MRNSASSLTDSASQLLTVKHSKKTSIMHEEKATMPLMRTARV